MKKEESKLSNEKPINARFWIFWNGDFVKLTLAPGSEVSFGYSQTHEEGFAAVHETYSYDGISVECETYSVGRDCDGRHSSTSTSFADVCSLKAKPCFTFADDGTMRMIPGIMRPNWHSGKSRCYDQYAEASGY